MSAEFVTIRADAARAATGSDLVIAGGWGFIANVLPIDLKNDRVHLPEQVEAQTRKVLGNFEAIIKARGLSKDQVVAVRVAIANLPRYEERFEVTYAGFFASDRKPARSVIGVAALPRGALIAMDFTLLIA